MAAEIQHWNATILDINYSPVKLNGIVTEVKAPKLERDFDTEKRAGESGVIARPKFFNEVELSFTVKRIFPNFVKAIMQAVNLPLTFQCNTIIESATGVNEVYSWYAKGYPSSLPFGDLNADGMDSEVTLMCSFLSCTYGTFTMVYDPANYVYSINGSNQFNDIKLSLGI